MVSAQKTTNCKYSLEASEGYLLFCLLFYLFSPLSLIDTGEVNLLSLLLFIVSQ